MSLGEISLLSLHGMDDDDDDDDDDMLYGGFRGDEAEALIRETGHMGAVLENRGHTG